MKTIFDRLDHILRERPLGCACLAFMIFTAFLLFSPTLVKVLLFFFAAVFGTVLLFLRKKSVTARFHPLRAAVCLFVAALACLSCFLSYDLFDRRMEKAAAENAYVKVELYLDGVVYDSDFSALYTATVRSAGERSLPGVKALVSFGETRPELFTLYTGIGKVASPTGTEPGFDAEAYYRAKGIFCAIENGDELTNTSKEVYVPARLFYALKSEIVECIDGFTEGNTAALLTALLTGDRSRLPDTLVRDFGTLGVSHLLAVSGLHLSVLFFFADRLMKRLLLPLKVRVPIEIVFIVLFMGVCGFSASVTRAGIMLILFVLAALIGEKSDGFTSLLLSGAIIVFFSPFTVFNTGFLLSFFSAFGILFLSKMRSKKEKSRFPRPLAAAFDALAVSFAAQIAVLSVTLPTFGSFSILSPLFTLILSLPVSLILYLSPICLILSLLPFLSSLSSAAITLPCNFTVFLSSFARYFKAFGVRVRPLPALLFLLLLALAFLWIMLARKRRVPFVLICVGYFCLCFYSMIAPRFQGARVLTSVEGRNDVILVFGEGRCSIIDLSDGSKNYYRSAIDLMRRKTDILHPDTVVLTHCHLRHAESLEYLFENVYLEYLLLPKPETDEAELYLSLADKAEKAGVNVLIYGEKDDFSLSGDVRFSNYEQSAVKRSTHPVFSFRLSKGDVSCRYLSSSAWEVFDFPGNDALYFCVHGPKADTMPDRDVIDNHAIFCPDDELYRYFFGEDREKEEYSIFTYE